MNFHRNVKYFSSKIVKLDINTILSNNSTKSINTHASKQNLIHYYPVSNKFFDNLPNHHDVIDTNCNSVINY